MKKALTLAAMLLATQAVFAGQPVSAAKLAQNGRPLSAAEKQTTAGAIKVAPVGVCKLKVFGYCLYYGPK